MCRQQTYSPPPPLHHSRRRPQPQIRGRKQEHCCAPAALGIHVGRWSVAAAARGEGPTRAPLRPLRRRSVVPLPCSRHSHWRVFPWLGCLIQRLRLRACASCCIRHTRRQPTPSAAAAQAAADEEAFLVCLQPPHRTAVHQDILQRGGMGQGAHRRRSQAAAS